jgi:protocatechuate 3,4-dioxygenase beta subunit
MEYRRDHASHPPFAFGDYRSTGKRAPSQPLVPVRHTLSETSGPVFGAAILGPTDHDLTAQHGGSPIGERIIVAGRVLDADGSPVNGTLVELWQANAAGRYAHPEDTHDAPLDPNFSGGGRCLTGVDGWYRFVTIRPGAYPWANHDNAWRPAHLHFSVFGPAWATRLITQMYFPGDPLLAHDPIFRAVPEEARPRLVAAFDLSLTESGRALGYRWDIVLRGPAATPQEAEA